MTEKQDRIMTYKDKLSDWNSDHNPGAGYADDVLCKLLRELGYGEVVEMYCKLREEYNE